MKKSSVRSSARVLRPKHGDIAVAAYHLYLERGAEEGHDLDDWLRAETLLTQRLAESAPEDSAVEQTQALPPVAPPVHSNSSFHSPIHNHSASREEIRRQATPFRPAPRQRTERHGHAVAA